MTLSTYATTLNEISTKPTRVVTTHQGGEAYLVDDLKRMRRFLVLGSASGSYYVNEKQLTKENYAVVAAALDVHGPKAVDLICEVLGGGLSPKLSPSIVALAMACAHKDDATRTYALSCVPRVLKTATQLFEFCEYVQTLRGWGRGLRKAIGAWYTHREITALVYQVIKYRQRNGWTHRDVLRLAHPKVESETANALYKWIVDAEIDRAEWSLKTHELDQLLGFLSIQEHGIKDKATALRLITAFDLPREALPTELLNDPNVWEALLQKMPMTAMVRNLATMTSVGLLDTNNDATQLVVRRLNDSTLLRRAKVHPMAVLIAMKTYTQGRGYKGSQTWRPIPKIVDALDAAFYGTFTNVEPTRKDILVGIDVSGSMNAAVVGAPFLTAREAAVAMALITLATEPNAEVVDFNTSLGFPKLSARQRLDDALTTVRRGGGTDLVLPISYALQDLRTFDAIVIYTDNENGGDNLYPTLERYRAAQNKDAKLVAVALAANEYSVAKPHDPNALDVVGFDATAPNIIGRFINDEI